ncbi:amino acid kinase family protein [Gimesia aquarii]|uniref:Amino acid kinase family protein n=1 Tax=Gimesia aquarii TaxID=2527964 RepID=A0A517VSQ9_9PLAN|nr:hypothetical protein [Gimesia aquarii]QDT96047.1 Amino acid kinase family protein [Gimesia aquarii]
MKTAVIKIGGSLFDLPDLAGRIAKLLDSLENTKPLIVCGGGKTVDVVRSWDQTHQLGDRAAHWLAIQSLMLNDQLLCQLLPDARIITSPSEAKVVWQERGVPILSAYAYLQQTLVPQVTQLPESWDVTSDSIAAWVSLTWPADELILLKSIELPKDRSPSKLALAGLVDSYLPTIAESLPQLSWCNLRSDSDPLQLDTVISGNSFHIRNATGPA